MNRRSVLGSAGALVSLLGLAAAGVESPADAGKKKHKGKHGSSSSGRSSSSGHRSRSRSRRANRRPEGKRLRFCEDGVPQWQHTLTDCG